MAHGIMVIMIIMRTMGCTIRITDIAIILTMVTTIITDTITRIGIRTTIANPIGIENLIDLTPIIIPKIILHEDQLLL